MFLIEGKRRYAKALEQLRSGADAGSEIDVIHGDANVELPQILAALDPARDRAVVFLDPYGMSVNWTTLESIARTQLVDLWYLFPLSGLYRNAPNDAKAISLDKEAALNRMLGTDRWRTEFYETSPQLGMFGDDPDEVRVADVSSISRWVTRRLKDVFPEVLAPKILYQQRQSGKHGAALFALFFAIANPRPEARGLAVKIAKHVLND